MKTPKALKYKDVDGQYLTVLEGDDQYRIVWYLPDEGDYGLVLTNDPVPGPDREDTDVAVDACIHFFAGKRWDMPAPKWAFVFPSARLAAECLRYINAELCAWKAARPLPEWAKTALENGWKPPKSWSP